MELNDLPDEILLTILRKLNNLEVLYSFHGVNQRLNGIIHDPIFTSHLSFVKWSSNKIINNFSCPTILDRFSSQILPEICKKIKWFDLDLSFMKHILHANNYSNLYGLGLYNIEEETIKSLFNVIQLCLDKSLSSNMCNNQITALIIGIDPDRKNSSTVENLCNLIFSVFNNLIDLIFYHASYRDISRLMLRVPSVKFASSTLLTLDIKVFNFDDCLYILDGRFNKLHTLYIDLIKIYPPSREIENQRKLANLKCFNLTCILDTSCYNELILPLLYRMSNLEKLGLYFKSYVEDRFLDGNNLKENILDRMTKLKQFDFDIHSFMFMKNQLNFPSQENIQQTFKDFQCTKIISCVDYFHEGKKGQCHIYSYPFLMKSYQQITNHFPGGFYPYVRIVSLYDEHPFEHEFFLRISLSFPLISRLTLTNHCSQKSNQSMINDHNFEIVKYYHLTELDIRQVHDDYLEEFLLNAKTYLHNSISLDVDFRSLERITQNFTRNETRINCIKVNEIFLYGENQYSIQSLQNYFPFAKID